MAAAGGSRAAAGGGSSAEIAQEGWTRRIGNAGARRSGHAAEDVPEEARAPRVAARDLAQIPALHVAVQSRRVSAQGGRLAGVSPGGGGEASLQAGAPPGTGAGPARDLTGRHQGGEGAAGGGCGEEPGRCGGEAESHAGARGPRRRGKVSRRRRFSQTTFYAGLSFIIATAKPSCLVGTRGHPARPLNPSRSSTRKGATIHRDPPYSPETNTRQI